MAVSSTPGNKYVELPVHIWYDQKLNKVFVASSDPEFDVIFGLKRGSAPDTRARGLLTSHGKM